METFGGILPWIQVGLSIILVTLIVLQQNEAGLGGAFGGNDSSSFHSKRGAEKFLFYSSIVVAILFAITSITALFV